MLYRAIRSAGQSAGNWFAQGLRSRQITGRLVADSSKAEFIAKLGTVEEEADESCLWLELVIESGLMEEKLVVALLEEAKEITAIMAASKISARANK